MDRRTQTTYLEAYRGRWENPHSPDHLISLGQPTIGDKEIPSMCSNTPRRDVKAGVVFGTWMRKLNETRLIADVEKKVLGQFKSYLSPAADVADGVACFTFTDIDLAEQVDELAALA